MPSVEVSTAPVLTVLVDRVTIRLRKDSSHHAGQGDTPPLSRARAQGRAAVGVPCGRCHRSYRLSWGRCVTRWRACHPSRPIASTGRFYRPVHEIRWSVYGTPWRSVVRDTRPLSSGSRVSWTRPSNCVVITDHNGGPRMNDLKAAHETMRNIGLATSSDCPRENFRVEVVARHSDTSIVGWDRSRRMFDSTTNYARRLGESTPLRVKRVHLRVTAFRDMSRVARR